VSRAVAAVFAAIVSAATAQAPAKFEVASVKRCKTGVGTVRGAAQTSPARLDTCCDLLADEGSVGLIQRAYVRFAGGRMNPFDVVPIEGGPGWIRSEAYRIEARAAGAPSVQMMQGPMLQALLEDRFRLRIRRTTRQGPVYVLSTTKNGVRLKPTVEGGCMPPPSTFPPPALAAGQRYCKVLIAVLAPAIEAEHSSIAEFAKLLSRVVGRPVIDQSGAEGRFDIHLEFARDDATPGLSGPLPDGAAPATDTNRATIFTAIQEQLGLKLTAASGPVDVLVIDHIERPTGN
jgi:uncharacterized protein (TIGR03435 family)